MELSKSIYYGSIKCEAKTASNKECKNNAYFKYNNLYLLNQ